MRLTQSKAFFSCLFLSSSKSPAFASAFLQSSLRTVSSQRSVSAAAPSSSTSTSNSKLNFSTSSVLKHTTHFDTSLYFQKQNSASFSTLCINNRNNNINNSNNFSNSNMDVDFNKATNRRMKALFSRDNSSSSDGNNTGGTTRDYSTKNRSKELKRLAQAMDTDVGKLKELLRNRRANMDDNSEKATYIDWMLTKESKKRVRKPSDVSLSEEKKTEDGSSSNGRGDASRKKKPIRVKRQTVQVNEDPADSLNVRPTNGSGINMNTVQDKSLLSNLKFADVDEIHPNSKKAITQILKIESMTEIQSKTFHTAVTGTDVLGRARTGTGKTLAFLTPALERLLINNQYKPGENVGVLIISPTRELASQIGDQAEKLITYHRGLSCQVMYGGTKMGRDINMLNKRLPSFLVATPGRLLDHLENTVLSNGRKFGYDIMRETGILVLDETDRLLDMGFRREIAKIMAYLPKQERRQTLLFSATVPQELKKIMAENMKKDYVEVDCINDGGNNPDGGTHTNSLVKQTYCVLPSLQQQVSAVVQLVHDQMEADPDAKIVVFFSTARMVGYFAEFFNRGLGIEVIEIHSKKSQSYRNKASEQFRNAKRGALFTSDVSARGVDYPNVTGVIQVGLPESRDQYIHRLGRTGRAGKEGQGILLLAPFEERFVSELKNIDIIENKDATALINGSIDPQMEQRINGVLSRIRSGDSTLTVGAEQAYQAFIGYYNGQMKRTSLRTKDDLVETANNLANILGLKEQPGLTKRAIGKMGLKGVRNLRIVSESEIRGKMGGGGRGGGGRGGGRGGGGRGGGRGGRGRR